MSSKQTRKPMPNRIIQTESERLYVIETKLDSVLSSIEALTRSTEKYATKQELEQAIVDRNDKIRALIETDVKLARKHAITIWLTSTLAAGFGVIMTLLIQNLFK